MDILRHFAGSSSAELEELHTQDDCPCKLHKATNSFIPVYVSSLLSGSRVYITSHLEICSGGVGLWDGRAHVLVAAVSVFILSGVPHPDRRGPSAGGQGVA